MHRSKFVYFLLGLLVLIFFKGVTPGISHPSADVNLYLLQAESFLQGKWDIAGAAHDAALYQNHYYVVFPPFPALLLTPFVWLFEVQHVNVVLISTLLSLLNAYMLWKILTRLAISTEVACWLMIGFFMGTAYWMAVKGSSGVWFFAHIVAVTALILAINEAFGKGRGWLVGLYFGMALLSRQMTVYALPFFIGIFWHRQQKERLWPFFGSLAIFIGGYLWMNWSRFGDPFDTGYAYILQNGYLKERLDAYGLFNVHYLPFNFTYLFLQGFHVEFTGKNLLSLHCLDPFGTSLTFASPFLFFAFRAKWPAKLLITAWISIVLMIIHSLFYYTNGYYQINAQRFTLDFLPILIILAALGAAQSPGKTWKALIIYSVVLNLLASFYCAFSA